MIFFQTESIQNEKSFKGSCAVEERVWLRDKRHRHFIKRHRAMPCYFVPDSTLGVSICDRVGVEGGAGGASASVSAIGGVAAIVHYAPDCDDGSPSPEQNDAGVSFCICMFLNE